MAAAAPQVKLVCTAGPVAGEEFELVGDELVIGRAKENAISIPDTSVSRRHVLVRRLPRGWAASDMGSGNGTLVNGEPIAEETVLKHGDVITIGDTELSLVDKALSTDKSLARAAPRRMTGSNIPARGAAPRRSTGTRAMEAVDPEAQARRRRMFLIGGAVLGVVLLSLVGLKVKLTLDENRKLADKAESDRQRREVSSIFQEGKNLVREGKWVEAKAKFEEVQQIRPDYPSLQDYLSRAGIEIPNQEHLAAAVAALERNAVGTAAAALSKVTEDTQMYQQRRTLRTQVEEKLSVRLGEAKAAMDQSSADPKKLELARDITDELLGGFPDNRDAVELNKAAKVAIAERDRPRPVQVAAGPKPWDAVVARYRDGDVTGAFSLANECAVKRVPQCRTLQGQITEVADLNKKIDTLGAKELAKLIELDDRIAGDGGSKISRSARTKLGSVYYKSASAAKAAGEWGRAMEFANKALKVDGQNPGAQAIVTELRGKAKDLYLQAYQLKDAQPDEAVKLFKEVCLITPSGDELHGKAKKRIEELEK